MAFLHRISIARASAYASLFGLLLILASYHSGRAAGFLEPSHLNVVRRELFDPIEIEANYNLSRSHLLRREDYTCGPGNPCSNAACCGASGYCGYGPTYCGDGCSSNCGAVAECGKDAVPANKKCPLNTCCSQYGFCGTTTDFCGDECQSNCVEHPDPPGGQSGKVLDRVIGYYEAWSARSTCHKQAPSDIAIDALTHVNYAFAYIDPNTFEVTTMDTATSADTFADCANLKSIKPELKVFVSIGGWTFSDNGTSTQAVFGDIASSEANRQKFAANVVKFMNVYGFDGLDLDWEYPGAPDRGGQKADTANYVSLVKTLRSTFDGSGRQFGLTFTAPSSFWYLRWFDLPGMIEHVDWVNLMSYDLHGVWDRQNPIGSIVQGHTNLTEIKLATELFWRVGIPPGKISMGFGFYGRAFTLADPSCTTPGCQFSGASKPGPCTATGGYLAHYEIAAILNGNGAARKRDVQTTHDEDAAVNYFTFDNDQWISFDDKVTFKQKTDWADSVGLGGSLIWASDLDDDTYSQHSGLVGRDLKQTQDIKNPIVADPQKQPPSLSAELGEQCFKMPDCVDLNNPQSSSCGAGFTAVGFDDAGCGSKKCHCGKPICCPTDASPKNCQWRGGGSGDCDGRCAPGEVNIKGFASSWGGGFLNDGNTNKCGRGYKVFCCEALDVAELTAGCKLGPCGGGCPDDYDKTYPAAYSPDNPLGTCPLYYASQDFCCPRPTRFKECRWYAGDKNKRGAFDCPNAHCDADEIEIAQSSYGDSAFECAWGQKQVACCKLTDPPPAGPDHATCSVNLCDVDPGYCDSADGPTETKRDLSDTTDLGIEPHYGLLEKRGGPNKYPIKDLLGNLLFELRGGRWNPVRDMFRGRQGQYAPRRIIYLSNNEDDDCDLTTPTTTAVPPGESPYEGVSPLPQRAQNDHAWEQQIPQQVVQAGVTRRLPSGGPVLSPMNSSLEFWRDRFQGAVLRQGLGIVGPGGVDPQIPAQRIFEAGGSINNQQNMVPLAAELNGPKGKMFKLQAPTAENVFRGLVDTAAQSGRIEDARLFLQHIRVVLAIFNSLNDPALAQESFNRAHAETVRQYGIIEGEMPDAEGLSDFTAEVTEDFLRTVEGRAQTWLVDQIGYAQGIFDSTRDANGNRPNSYIAVIAALSNYRSKIQNARLPRGDNGGGT